MVSTPRRQATRSSRARRQTCSSSLLAVRFGHSGIARAPSRAPRSKEVVMRIRTAGIVLLALAAYSITVEGGQPQLQGSGKKQVWQPPRATNRAEPIARPRASIGGGANGVYCSAQWDNGIAVHDLGYVPSGLKVSVTVESFSEGFNPVAAVLVATIGQAAGNTIKTTTFYDDDSGGRVMHSWPSWHPRPGLTSSWSTTSPIRRWAATVTRLLSGEGSKSASHTRRLESGAKGQMASCSPQSDNGIAYYAYELTVQTCRQWVQPRTTSAGRCSTFTTVFLWHFSQRTNR